MILFLVVYYDPRATIATVTAIASAPPPSILIAAPVNGATGDPVPVPAAVPLTIDGKIPPVVPDGIGNGAPVAETLKDGVRVGVT